MITKFGSLFAGHVDLEDIGLDGTPVNDRFLSEEQLNTVYEKTEAIVKLMDRVGYDVFWSAEHRFQREGYECLPNLLMLYVHLAHITKNIKFGCGFNITPHVAPPAVGRRLRHRRSFNKRPGNLWGRPRLSLTGDRAPGRTQHGHRRSSQP